MTKEYREDGRGTHQAMASWLENLATKSDEEKLAILTAPALDGGYRTRAWYTVNPVTKVLVRGILKSAPRTWIALANNENLQPAEAQTLLDEINRRMGEAEVEVILASLLPKLWQKTGETWSGKMVQDIYKIIEQTEPADLTRRDKAWIQALCKLPDTPEAALVECAKACTDARTLAALLMAPAADESLAGKIIERWQFHKMSHNAQAKNIWHNLFLFWSKNIHEEPLWLAKIGPTLISQGLRQDALFPVWYRRLNWTSDKDIGPGNSAKAFLGKVKERQRMPWVIG